jgi:hypothetical protein
MQAFDFETLYITMSFLIVSFWLLSIFSTNAAVAPVPVDFRRDEKPDWSALFPEFQGCERVIQPLAQNGKIFEQTARYERQGFRENKNQFYVPCGTVTLRFEPSARKTASANHAKSFEIPPVGKRKVKNFDAYMNSPLCGNDEWMGSTSVFFDENMSLTVSAYRGTSGILEFAETADYAQLKKTIDEFVEKSQDF